MKNKLNIFALWLLLAAVALGQTVNVQKGAANNNITGDLNIGAGRTLDASAGTVTFANGQIPVAKVNGAAPTASPTFTGTVSGITKSMVGLGNVDNTSDANKPVSTAQAASITAEATARSLADAPQFGRMLKTRTKLATINAGGIAQLRWQIRGDSLGSRYALYILPILINRYGIAGYYTDTGSQLTSFMVLSGAAAVYPGSNDFTVSTFGRGISMSASGDMCMMECLNASPNAFPYSPAITPAAQVIYNADRVSVVFKAHGAFTGGTFKLQTSADNSTFVDVPGYTAVTVTAATTAQITTATLATPRTVRSIRVVWVSGGFVFTQCGAWSTTSAGVIPYSSALGGETLANMAGATDAQALANWFGADVVSFTGRNDSLAAMAAAWTLEEGLFTSLAPDRLYLTVPQSSGDWVSDPGNTRNALIKARCAAAGGVLVDVTPYQLGAWTNGDAYTNANAAGKMADATHPNNILWAQVSREIALCFGFPAAVIDAAIPVQNRTIVAGNLELAVAGNGLRIREGTNARMGVAVLVNGTVTISNTSVKTGTRFILTRVGKNASTAIGQLSVETVTASTSFVITSLSALALTETGDQSTIHWQLVEAADAPII